MFQESIAVVLRDDGVLEMSESEKAQEFEKGRVHL